MECFLTELGKTLADKLINGVTEKSRYIFCFNSIAKEFEEEKIKLEAERITMRQRFKVATAKGRDIQSNAEFWETRANKLIQENTETNQSCFFGFCPDCIWRYKRGEELTTKIEEIEKLMEKGEKLENVEIARVLPDVERYSSQYYISFKSRELIYKKLLDALKDDSNYITGLHGMGGTGKTTLAKEVGKQLKTSERFEHVIDTTVSFVPDIKKIQDDIAGSLGLELRDVNESDRPKKLWSRLTNGEKILVILDDVWGNLNFDDIGLPNSDNHKGCKVLVTTRNLSVCNKMVCGETIRVELLSEEDAWIMFKMHANLNNISTKSFLDKGRKIAIECKRLPVAIATIASSLKGQKRREEWDVALKSLQKHVSMDDVDDDLVDIYKCLKFSYDYLKDEKAKGLFLLCSLFQEDEEIPVEILTRLGIGVGLFAEDYDCYGDVRSQAAVAKNKLLDSCLLLETDKGDVKMHDLVREVAQWIANKEIQTVNFSNKNQKSLVERDKNIKYLLYEGNLEDLVSSSFNGSKLEILIVKIKWTWGDFVDVRTSFFGNMVGLRVLKFSYETKSSTYFFTEDLKTLSFPQSLPQSIQSLTNIRSLLVEGVNLGDISGLGSLQSLETIDLDHCEIDELPREIANLEKLRLLKLEQCKIRSNNPFEVIQRCPSLEELYFCESFNHFCQEITLPILQRYRLIESLNTMNDSLSKCVSLHEDCFSEATLKYLMQTTELLQLEIFNKECRNLMPEIVPTGQGMNDLIELNLKYAPQLQCLVDTEHVGSQIPNVFSKLVVLHLEGMGNLEELCNGPISFDSMNNLEELAIEDCENLRSLFKCSLNLCNLKTIKLTWCSMLDSVFEMSTSQSLLMLENLEITDCEKLENIITYERRVLDDSIEELSVNGDNDKNKSFNSMFPKLRVINIKRCPQLQFILPLLSAKDLLLLEAITIEHCDKLKYIFGQHQDVELASLKELELHDLPSFIDIIPKSHHFMPSSIKGSSNSISKPQTQLEPIKSNILSWSHICCHRYKLKGTTSSKIPLVSDDQQQDCSISMVSSSNYPAQCLSRSISSHTVCNIKVIKLMNLPKIKSVFIMSIASKLSLETLTIKNCDELEHIIVDIGDGSSGGNVFPKLKELYIENCEKLIYIFGHIINASDDNQNQNEVIHLHLPILECLNLCNLQSLIGMCTKNYRTTLPALTEVELIECSKVDIRSIGDFSVTNHSVSISQEIGTTIKELSGNMENFRALKTLMVKNNSKVESFFCLNEVSGQEMNLDLRRIELHVLPMMTCIFVGPKNSFALQNLARLKIMRCEKLEIVFSTSITKYLPQLLYIRIEECKELKYMIEDDLENKRVSNSLSSRTCFPELESLVVVKCNKLKCIFQACKYFPKLKALMISEADQLEEIFDSEGDEKVNIPNLRVVAFVNLPSLCHDQGIQFQAVEYRCVQNCQKLSLTSALTNIMLSTLHYLDVFLEPEVAMSLEKLFKQSNGESEEHESTGSESGHESTSSPELLDEEGFNAAVEMSVEEGTTSANAKAIKSLPQSKSLSSLLSRLATSKEYSDGQIDIASPPVAITKPVTTQDVDVKIWQETSKTNVDKVSLNDEAVIKVTSSIEEHFPKDVQSKFSPIVHSPLALSPSMVFRGDPSQIYEELEDGDGQIAMTSFSISTTETNDEVSRNDDAFKKLSSNIDELIPKDDDITVSKLIPKDDDITVSKSKPSPSITFPVACQFPSVPSKGDPSQKVEDFNSSLLVMRELKQLVSKKHLDYDNLSMLSDFLVKHPSVPLKDTSLSNRYKGYAYNCLGELLKFLQTHSVLDVLGSSHLEFVELLQDVRKCGFDKEWLDDVEKRTLFPGVQVSEDTLQKLLDSKHILTQHVKDLNHQLTSSKAVLESIIQQEAQILETRASLSDPIGY